CAPTLTRGKPSPAEYTVAATALIKNLLGQVAPLSLFAEQEDALCASCASSRNDKKKTRDRSDGVRGVPNGLANHNAKSTRPAASVWLIPAGAGRLTSRELARLQRSNRRPNGHPQRGLIDTQKELIEIQATYVSGVPQAGSHGDSGALVCQRASRAEHALAPA
ncbi:MAG: hypothetical protein BJ554DRAFT_5818, partial [Olpidium bornovanus]